MRNKDICYIAGFFPATARPCFPPNAMSGQHCESYDVKRETVHCYPVNSSLLTAVVRDGWNLSAVFKFCFRISMFPSTSSRETLRISGNKIHCSPRDQSLSVYCWLADHFMTSNKFLLFSLFSVFRGQATDEWFYRSWSTTKCLNI